MTTLLDEIVNNHPTSSGAASGGASGGARVLSEENDFSKINFVAGLSDPGEMIRCGYLPEIRRLPGEKDEPYADRIRPIVMALPKAERDKIMQAAIKRASLATTADGSIMYAGVYEDWWTKLGKRVSKAMNSREAGELSGIDYPVEKVAAKYTWNEREFTSQKNFLIIRGDTGAELGRCGPNYKTIQNVEMFKFLDNVRGEFGAEYDVAGGFDGGAGVFIQMRLPKYCWKVKGKDQVETHATFVGFHDGVRADKCFASTRRTVCKNSTRLSLVEDGKSGISIRHTGDIQAKVEDARKALGLSICNFETFKEASEVMAKTPVDINWFGNTVLDGIMEINQADSLKGADALAAAIAKTEAERELKTKVFQKQIDFRKTLLQEILERHENETNKVNGMQGTVWGGLQTVTEVGNHSTNFQRFRGSDHAKASRKFESLVTGESDKLHQVAIQTAMGLVRNA